MGETYVGRSQERTKSSTRPSKKKTREAPPPPKSLSETKKRLRSTLRLLNKPNLPSNQKVELERQVKALEILKTQFESGNDERTNAKKYHKVKFFDRQKVLRKIKKLEKSFKESENDDSKENELHKLFVKLNYTLFYPNTDKYIALYPTVEITDAERKEAIMEKQKEILESIEDAMNKGTLPKDSRQKSTEERGTLRKDAKRKRREALALYANKTAGVTSDGHNQPESDAESEDDFFESDPKKPKGSNEESDDSSDDSSD
ncbi:18S rRNA maturation protein [Mycoemilia scoparia]|uniref:rRNA-processing protein EFG1 n=1 Tax=Mycoemilia scoparia TaxID=417184 RepID=A0A9W8A475_9FUNG|nr:18S rRNA maturation protein [Mycoemilia scoparia]